MVEFSLSSLTPMWFCESLNNKSIIDYGVEEKKKMNAIQHVTQVCRMRVQLKDLKEK